MGCNRVPDGRLAIGTAAWARASTTGQHSRPRRGCDEQRADRRRDGHRGIAVADGDHDHRRIRIAFSFLALNPGHVHAARRENRATRRRRSREPASLPISRARSSSRSSPALKTIGRVAARGSRQSGARRDDQRRLFGQRRRTKSRAVGRRFGFAQSSLRRDRQRPRRVGALGTTGLVSERLHSRRRLRSSRVRVRRRSGRAAIRLRADRDAFGARPARSASLHRRNARDVELVGARRLHQPSHQDRHESRAMRPPTAPSARRSSTTSLGRNRRRDARPPLLVLRRPRGRRSRRIATSTSSTASSDPQYFYPLSIDIQQRRVLTSSTAAARSSTARIVHRRSELRRALLAGRVVLSSRRIRSRKRDELSLRHSASRRTPVATTCSCSTSPATSRRSSTARTTTCSAAASIRAAFRISTRPTTAARSGRRRIPAQLYTGPFPSSPDRPRLQQHDGQRNDDDAVAASGPNQRDGNNVGFSVEKVQYQRNFDNHSYLRVLGYGEWSDWLINGPNGAQLTFAADPAEYDVLAWIYGAVAIYSNQLGSKNLFTGEPCLQHADARDVQCRVQQRRAELAPRDRPRHGASRATSAITATATTSITGAQWSCFGAGSQGGLFNHAEPGCPQPQNFPYICLTPGDRAAGFAGGEGRRALDHDRERQRRAVRRRAPRTSVRWR